MSSPAPKRKITDYVQIAKKVKVGDDDTGVESTDALVESTDANEPVVEVLEPISSYDELEKLLPACWRKALDLDNQPWWAPLKKELVKIRAANNIYPPLNDTFNAFRHCLFADARVVIIGQDPYHNTGEAMGLCFSVPRGITVPSSLRNIYKELESDLPGFGKPLHGDLSSWATQGVLLLNATLTVEHNKPNIHEKIGWAKFTDHVVNVLNKQKSGLVWMLWGGFAQKKAAKVDKTKNCILSSPHPSGLSAHRGFFGCKHFSACNNYLEKQNKKTITWSIPK